MHTWKRWNLIFALVLITAGVLLGRFADFGRVRPSPENESAFFNAFDPHDTITYFQVGNGGSRTLGESSSSEYSTAKHGRTFDEHYFVRNGEQYAIDHALRNTIRASLMNSHATILNESITPNGGVLFQYVNGRTRGTVNLHPTAPGSARRNDAPADAIDVHTLVSIDEKWTKD